MGRHRSRACGKNERNVKSRRRITQILPTRRLRLEALEDRRLLSLAGVVGVPPLGGLEWLTQSTDEPAEAATPGEIAFSGEAGILTAAPATPDLLDISDTGVSNIDNLTNLDNSAPDRALQFSVGGTIVGATVTLYAQGVAIGNAVAAGTTTTITTNGSFDLVDGPHAITARQTLPGEDESADSAALEVTIDTVAPEYRDPVRRGGYDTGGRTAGVTVSGTLAYLADLDRGLVTIDVTNPAAPVRLGGYDAGTYAYGVAVIGTTAYVANNTAGLVIIDVTNPAAPARLGGYDTSGEARDVAVSGNRVYVADGHAGLQIIDVTNPAAPVRLGGYDTAGYAHSVVVSGTLAYVADSGSGLQIIDVGNPAAPVRLGTLDTSGAAYDVSISGTLAYVADDNAGLVVIDVTNPAAPVRLGGYDTGGYAYDVAVSGTRAYVADNNAGLVVIDVTNPAAPVRLGGYDTGGYAYGVAVSGTLAYVSDYYGGLAIFDVLPPSTPPAPDLQAPSDTGASSTDNITADNTPTFDLLVPAGSYFRFYRDGVQISGDYHPAAPYTTYYTTAAQADSTYRYTVAAVDAAGNASLPSAALAVTVDSTIPATPDLLAVSDSGISHSDRITNLDNSQPDKSLQFLVGNTSPGATVTVYADGTPIGSAVATSATTTVTTNGTFDLADGIRAITARQTLPGRAETVDSAAISVTIDTAASSLLSPVRLGGYDTTGSAWDVFVAGTVAYVADGPGGLAILDVSNPNAPVWLGGFSGTARGVVVSGTLAYVADAGAGLQVLDVSNPAAPVKLNGSRTSSPAYGVTLCGTLAYVAAQGAGLEIIDVSDPAQARRISGCVTAGVAYDVAVSGNVAYLATGDAGLEIFDVTNPSMPMYGPFQ
ncbi:MAG: Ig-like domain-containing protein [Pirellulales bacterium]